MINKINSQNIVNFGKSIKIEQIRKFETMKKFGTIKYIGALKGLQITEFLIFWQKITKISKNPSKKSFFQLLKPLKRQMSLGHKTTKNLI